MTSQENGLGGKGLVRWAQELRGFWKGICVSVEVEWGVRPVRTGTGRNICEGKKKPNRRPRVRRNRINCTCEGEGKRYKLKEEV